MSHRQSSSQPTKCTNYVIVQESYYTPYREVDLREKKMKITPHGHVEERLKTVRKIECVHVRKLSRKRIIVDDFDESGVPVSVDGIRLQQIKNILQMICENFPAGMSY